MTIPITFNDQYLNQTVNKDARRPGETYSMRCWHETANGSGNPHSTLNWNLKRAQVVQGKTIVVASSYDVLIARDGEIWRYVDWKVWNSWSEGVSSWVVDGVKLESGALGRACLGTELDGANNGKQKATEAQIESAAKFAIYTWETEGIPLDGDHDVTHAQIAPGRKTDPRGYTIEQIYEAIRHFQQPVEPSLPPGTFPVDPKLNAYWERSGGLWQPDRYALGYAVSPLENGVQKFERGALRLLPSGSIEALLRSEWG